MEKVLVCTFSGGRTSAFLARYIQLNCNYDEYRKIYVFANTSKERQETIDFIIKCSKEWNMEIIFIQAVINREKGIGTDFEVIDYMNGEKLKMNGELFEDLLKAYPMPNNKASNCTRELKEVPIKKYIKSLGTNLNEKKNIHKGHTRICGYR